MDSFKNSICQHLTDYADFTTFNSGYVFPHDVTFLVKFKTATMCLVSTDLAA